MLKNLEQWRLHTGSSVPVNTTENFNFNFRVKYILFGYYSVFKLQPNTNTIQVGQIMWKRIRIYSVLKNHPNTNIQIIFGLKISAEYEHEYHYSVSTIRILFEFWIIRSPLYIAPAILSGMKRISLHILPFTFVFWSASSERQYQINFPPSRFFFCPSVFWRFLTPLLKATCRGLFYWKVPGKS